jgi:hypothetical protein
MNRQQVFPQLVPVKRFSRSEPDAVFIPVRAEVNDRHFSECRHGGLQLRRECDEKGVLADNEVVRGKDARRFERFAEQITLGALKQQVLIAGRFDDMDEKRTIAGRWHAGSKIVGRGRGSPARGGRRPGEPAA